MSTVECEVQLRTIVDDHVAPLVNSGGTPSAAQAPGGIAAVYLNGESYFFPYGSINSAGDSPTQSTLFGLGSVTKTFTTAILGQSPQLFGETVAGLLPPGFDLNWTQLPTFTELATFTAGINPSSPPGVQTQQQFIDFVNSRADPGLPAPWNYSDTSIGLLGQTLMYRAGLTTFEAADAQQWYTKNLFDALGMGATVPAPVTSGPLATAYAYANGAYTAIEYEPWCPWGTAGRMFSTAADMLNFVMAAVGTEVIGGKQVPATVLSGIAQALQPRATIPSAECSGVTITGQGSAWVAWSPEPVHETVIYSKDGALQGVSAYLAVNPALKYGAMVMLNMASVPVQCPTIGMMLDLAPLAAG